MASVSASACHSVDRRGVKAPWEVVETMAVSRAAQCLSRASMARARIFAAMLDSTMKRWLSGDQGSSCIPEAEPFGMGRVTFTASSLGMVPSSRILLRYVQHAPATRRRWARYDSTPSGRAHAMWKKRSSVSVKLVADWARPRA